MTAERRTRSSGAERRRRGRLVAPLAGRVARLLACSALLAAVLGCQPTPSPIPTPGPSGGQLPAATTPPGTAVGATPTTPGTPAAGDRPRLVIDTDVAPDDLIALASLLRDPSIEIMAITVSGTGEAHCDGGLRVVRALVTALIEAPLTVACGPAEPLGDAQAFPDAWRAGADAGSGLTLPQPDFESDQRPAQQILVDLAAAEALANRRLLVLTLGPLTNLAAAAELDPALPGKVRIVSMLGAIGVPGNVDSGPGGSDQPLAEWNAHADPTAIRLVLEAGFDLTLIPLDATNSVPLTPDLYRDLGTDHAAGPADVVHELLSRNEYMTQGGFYLWDPLAAAAVRNPDFVDTRRARLRVVEGAAPDGGRLIEDLDGVEVVIAVSADRSAFEVFLLDRLRFGGPRRS